MTVSRVNRADKEAVFPKAKELILLDNNLGLMERRTFTILLAHAQPQLRDKSVEFFDISTNHLMRLVLGPTTKRRTGIETERTVRDANYSRIRGYIDTLREKDVVQLTFDEHGIKEKEKRMKYLGDVIYDEKYGVMRYSYGLIRDLIVDSQVNAMLDPHTLYRYKTTAGQILYEYGSLLTIDGSVDFLTPNAMITLLGAGKYYQSNLRNFHSKVLYKAIEEVRENSNMDLQLEIVRDGGPRGTVQGYRFQVDLTEEINELDKPIELFASNQFDDEIRALPQYKTLTAQYQVNPARAIQLLKLFPLPMHEEQIALNLMAVDERIMIGHRAGRKVGNLGGMTFNAIKNNWRPNGIEMQAAALVSVQPSNDMHQFTPQPQPSHAQNERILFHSLDPALQAQLKASFIASLPDYLQVNYNTVFDAENRRFQSWLRKHFSSSTPCDFSQE